MRARAWHPGTFWLECVVSPARQVSAVADCVGPPELRSIPMRSLVLNFRVSKRFRGAPGVYGANIKGLFGFSWEFLGGLSGASWGPFAAPFRWPPEASRCLLEHSWWSHGGFLRASWRLLGGLFGASWGLSGPTVQSPLVVGCFVCWVGGGSAVGERTSTKMGSADAPVAPLPGDARWNASSPLPVDCSLAVRQDASRIYEQSSEYI